MQNNIYPEIEWIDVPHATAKNKFRRLLSKEFIIKSYIELEISRDALKSIYGVSDKVFTMSYWHHFTTEERRKIGNRKISLRQRTRNSNKHNKAVPNIKLDYNTLLEFLDKKYSLERMAKEFKVAAKTVKNNIEYYGVADKLVKGGMPYEISIAINSIDNLLGTSILTGVEFLNINNDKTDIHRIFEDIQLAYDSLTSLQGSLRYLRRTLNSRAAATKIDTSKYKLPTTRLNALCRVILMELGYNPICEFALDGRYYDFKLTDNILLEIDSVAYHSSPEAIARDEIKNTIAVNNGYKLLRVSTGKDKPTTLKNKIIECLKHLK